MTFRFAGLTLSDRRKHDVNPLVIHSPQATRVVGGVEPAPYEYPMVGYLEDGEIGRLLCGAALLSSRFAITAAHCAELFVNKPLVNLVVGDHDRSQRELVELSYGVSGSGSGSGSGGGK